MDGAGRLIERQVHQRLEARLLRNTAAPLVVGLSGGGDSVVLTLLADRWARAVGRPLVLATVDHDLQSQSRAWTDFCTRLAARLSRPLHLLHWAGEKPKTGLPAAARRARHRLLARAARDVGATTILLGHTADDRLESAAMRQEGATTPDPREWAPSPVWPDGRGLFVLRPMLEIRRRALRDWLTERGESWIEDPANSNQAYARARARQGLACDIDATYVDPPPLGLAAEAIHRDGVIALPRVQLRQALTADAARFVAMAAVCAGGGDRRPAGSRIARAVEVLRGAERMTATLAGARIEADDRNIRFFREAGEVARGGLAPITIAPDSPEVWDGRFEISAQRSEQVVRQLAGLSRGLSVAQREALKTLPPGARRGLPVRVEADDRVTSLTATGEARSLVGDRLAAAAGLVARELAGSQDATAVRAAPKQDAARQDP